MSVLDYQNRDDSRKDKYSARASIPHETAAFLRSMFGPTQREIWQQLAAQLSGKIVNGGFFKGDRLVAKAGQWTITLDTHTESNGETSDFYTRLRAPYVNRDGFRFTAARTGLLHLIGQMAGFPTDVRVGNTHFDEMFVLRGNSEQKVRALFSDPAIQSMMFAEPRVRMCVKDDEGWFGEHFPEGVDELHFSVLGVVKDLQRLRTLFDLFSAILHRLCQIGSAYENDPGIRI